MKWSNDVEVDETKAEIKWSATIIAKIQMVQWLGVVEDEAMTDQCGEPLKTKRVMRIYI